MILQVMLLVWAVQRNRPTRRLWPGFSVGVSSPGSPKQPWQTLMWPRRFRVTLNVLEIGLNSVRQPTVCVDISQSPTPATMKAAPVAAGAGAGAAATASPAVAAASSDQRRGRDGVIR